MPDKTHNAGGENRSQERRANPSRTRNRIKGRNPQSMIIAPPAFKQQLQKYCQRQTKNAKMFCVASLDVTGYVELEEHSGRQAAEQVNNFVLDLCQKFIRDADRICLASPGHLLLLLPETEAVGGKQALTRVAQTAAGAKLQHKHQTLPVNCCFKIAYSGEYGSDAEALLAATGYRISETGELIRIDTPAASSALPGEGWEPFCGSFPSWSERYSPMDPVSLQLQGDFLEIQMMKSADRWRGDESVAIRIFQPSHRRTIFDTTLLELIERRARVLQTINHPGVMPIRDYHVRERCQLYIVRDVVDVIPIKEAAAGSIATSTFLEWATQICNGLIYLQGLIPPVVPPTLEECVYLVPGSGHILLMDYEIPYLFPHWYQKIPVSNVEVEAALQGRPVAAYGPVIKSLSELLTFLFGKSPAPIEACARLLEKMSRDELPKELNTIYKIRSAIKEILDGCRMHLLTSEESPRA